MPPQQQQRTIYPFTANSTTHGGSGGKMPTTTTRPPMRQYSDNTPPTSTTNLLNPTSNNPYHYPQPSRLASSPASKNSVQAALSRGPLNDSKPSLSDGPYAASKSSGLKNTPSAGASVSEKFNLSPDPSYFLTPNDREADDYLHNPDPRRDRKNDRGGTIFTVRGFANLGCLILICVSLVGLFAGYPLAVYFTRNPISNLNAFNFGGINGTGQVTATAGHFNRIDPDTPSDALTITSTLDGSEMDLVFSDEFEVENRTFWPGDDPFWEAVDLHYWATNNLEWYYPGAITTRNGSLEVTLSQKENHNLHYQGGMVTSWNKFCFTGGTILTRVSLPGASNVLGLWPAVWTMGNLGRAGYGASLEGMWPYSYDSCDVGTMPNQTINGQPHLATVDGDEQNAGGALSFLPGQKLSRCSCPGSDHPGPIHEEDGSFVGRSAPEIDVLEAQVDGNTLLGAVSQSSQWAPFNYHYQWFEQPPNLDIKNSTISVLNTYTGGAFQQATSVVTTTDQSAYQLTGGNYETYGFEYKPGYGDAYITWISSGIPSWTLNAAGMAADQRVLIGARPVPQEPMYILINLGISKNFGFVDFAHLTFPAVMRVDWIRVYQPKDQMNIGCDPESFPTMDYISRHVDAYTNPNLTTWRDDYHQPFPSNKLAGACPAT